MPDWLDALLSWLQGSALGEAVRGTPFLYPTLEAIHILGIALLVGPAFAFDLRLLGVGATTRARDDGRALPAARLPRRPGRRPRSPASRC